MAQQTRANLASDQATNLADSSDITAAELRGEFTDLTDSALLREDIDTIAELNAIVADATIVTQGGALGTPSSGVATNLTGTASGLTAGTVTTNANLTGHVTSTGNAAVLGSFTVAQLNTALSDGTINTPEGTAVLSTGEGGGTKFLREDGDGTCSWQAVPGGITVTSGAGAPSSTPAAVGDIYVDTTADTTYNATGTASSADWTLNLDENSGTVLTDTAVATGDSIVFFDVDDSDNAKQRTWTNTISDLSLLTSGGALGTPSSGTATNLTGLPISTGVSGLGTGVATFLATPSSANLLSALTTKTGTGSSVFGTSPTIAAPVFSGTITGTYTIGGTPTFPATVMNTNSAQSVTAGIKKTFQADATNAGLRLAGVTSNPSSLVAGDLWYRSDTEVMSYRGTSAARSLVTADLTQTLTNKTLTNPKTSYTSFSAGEKDTGTFTPAYTDGNLQHITNGGAFTLAPQSGGGVIVLHITNASDAGTITTSGFSVTKGDAFTTTDTHEFICHLTVINSKSVLHVTALQ